MKTTLILFSLLFLTIVGFGQPADTLFFNKKWKQVPIGEKYKYVWILDTSLDSLGITEAHYENGLLDMVKVFKSPGKKYQNGKVIRINRDGKPNESILFNYDLVNDTIKEHLLNKYEELRHADSIKIRLNEFYKWKTFVTALYVNDLAYGEWTYLNKKKELTYIVEFSNDVKNGYYVAYYNSDDKVDEVDCGKIWLTGYYKNGKPDGLWTYYETDQTIYREIRYKNGKKVEDIKYY
ncbi:hypothetical protein EYV94_24755 [Puteibacter caeruleilacunae]|nr:hypothetical protein EYV94_24755 [Puteibacter caeruleilacunae]